MGQLLDFKDKDVVKVITGVRRCGKSTLLELFKLHLKGCGIPDERIVHINFDTAKYDYLLDGKAMWEYIHERVSQTETTYILLDEIQLVSEWEYYVNSLRIDCKSDIYVTGSNADLLATHRSARLAGRCVSIKMLPLSFKEYLLFNPIEETNSRVERDYFHKEKFEDYRRYGGMPFAAQAVKSEPIIAPYLLDIFDAVMSRDVIERNAVADPALLRTIAGFLVDNISGTVSTKKISGYLTSIGRKADSDVIDNYLNMLVDAFLFYGVKRYDIKGKLNLETLGKYYFVDTGMRNALLGYRETDYGHVLENIVYFELLRRYERVYIGKQNGYEVDFVVDSFNDRKYYQVAAAVMDETTFQRERRPLEDISDNYEKVILTMDNRDSIPQRNGIKLVNIIDFLLQP